MTQSYDSNFYKVTTLAELVEGKPSLFRAAGATVVLRRNGDSVEAIDGSCLIESGDMPHDDKIARILECVAEGSGSTQDWNELVTHASLPVKVEEGAVWVCVDACSSSTPTEA